MRGLLLASCLLLAVPALASPKVSVAEWQYLQRVGVVSAVNENLWKAFEDSGGWNAELARYARDTTRLNVRSLRAWGPPARPLADFHNSLVDVLALMDRFYGAIADRNFGDAEEIGARIRRRMADVESGWQKVEHRYAPPASR